MNTFNMTNSELLTEMKYQLYSLNGEIKSEDINVLLDRFEKLVKEHDAQDKK